jgi:precorrin-6B methylase 2
MGALETRVLGAVVQFLKFALALLLAAGATLAAAQQPNAPAFEPTYGQEGKDVVWVPTVPALVEKMLDMAQVTPQDTVFDLGSGDGRTVIAAARRGARAVGIEYDADMVALSRKNAEQAGVTGRAAFMQADLFETDLSPASVITMFLLPTINLQLRPALLKLKPGTRIVSNTFAMELWPANESAVLDQDTGCASWCMALLWIVPARVAGSYSLPQGELVLKQEFQILSGTLRTRDATYVLEGRVRGEELAFRAGGREYRGRANGKTLELR